MHTPQSIYKSGERALSNAMNVILDQDKTMGMPEMQKLVLLREVQKLHVQQSGMRSMIEGCAVLDDELARWRDECKRAARLILFVCEGSNWGEENRDQSSPEIGSPYEMWPDFELTAPIVDDLEEVF